MRSEYCKITSVNFNNYIMVRKLYSYQCSNMFLDAHLIKKYTCILKYEFIILEHFIFNSKNCPLLANKVFTFYFHLTYYWYLGIEFSKYLGTVLAFQHQHVLMNFGLGLWCLMPLSFNNISIILWWSVLMVEETRVPGVNHRPVASH